MKFKLNNLFFIAILFALSSCQPEGRIYSEHKDLSPEVEWLRKDYRDFQVEIDDPSKDYEMRLSFRYATGFQYEAAKIKVTETAPDGTVQTKTYQLKVREKNGEYIGEPGLDIWDSEHLVEATKKFNQKGTYTFRMEHDMEKDPLYYAMEIGLMLDVKK